jgi:Flp pilus assembly protein TadD
VPVDTAPPPSAAPAPAPTDIAPAAAAPTDTPQAAADPEAPTDPAAAKEEKKAARRALESGNLNGAIEAGERAVAHDPADGDSWLLLGAAYQEKGRAAEARKAFTSCIKEGKRGAIGECRAMLR